MIEGSLTFPHSCWVSQLDAVLRHTQDPELHLPLKGPFATAEGNNFTLFFQRIKTWHFMWHQLSWWFTWNIKTYFLWKINNKKFKCCPVRIGTVNLSAIIYKCVIVTYVYSEDKLIMVDRSDSLYTGCNLLSVLLISEKSCRMVYKQCNWKYF